MIVAMCSLLVVGAMLVGALTGIPDRAASVAQAQEPEVKPAPTTEDLIRWEQEWEAKGGAPEMGVGFRDIPLREGERGYTGETVEQMIARHESDVTEWPTEVSWEVTGGSVLSRIRPSQPGERELRFYDGTTMDLPEGVELIVTERAFIYFRGNHHPIMPMYTLQKGEYFAWVDWAGVNIGGLNDEEFPFLPPSPNLSSTTTATTTQE